MLDSHTCEPPYSRFRGIEPKSLSNVPREEEGPVVSLESSSLIYERGRLQLARINTDVESGGRRKRGRNRRRIPNLSSTWTSGGLGGCDIIQLICLFLWLMHTSLPSSLFGPILRISDAFYGGYGFPVQGGAYLPHRCVILSPSSRFSFVNIDAYGLSSRPFQRIGASVSPPPTPLRVVRNALSIFPHRD